MQDVKALAKSLKLLATDEFSLATATAINRVAFAAHKGSEANIRREFTLRNKFTLGSMLFYKASPKKDASKRAAGVMNRSRRRASCNPITKSSVSTPARAR